MYDFIVSMYAKGARIPGDCLPDFYPTRQAARDAAMAEIVRVATIPLSDRHPQIDWAIRYTIRRVKAI